MTNLAELLAAMDPKVEAGEFVFSSLSEDAFDSLRIKPLCSFREDEGVSVIVEKDVADRTGIPYTAVWCLITCRVASELSAVGFLAAITRELAAAQIPVNAISAYFHDHLFVPADRAGEALSILGQLSARHRHNQSSR